MERLADGRDGRAVSELLRRGRRREEVDRRTQAGTPCPGRRAAGTHCCTGPVCYAHPRISTGDAVTGAELLALYRTELKRLDLVLDPDEEVALAEAAALADRLVSVRGRLVAEGLTVTSKAGATKAHPLIASERMLSADVNRLLKLIRLDVSQGQGLTPAQKFRHEQKARGGRSSARARREGGR